MECPRPFLGSPRPRFDCEGQQGFPRRLTIREDMRGYSFVCGWGPHEWEWFARHVSGLTAGRVVADVGFRGSGAMVAQAQVFCMGVLHFSVPMYWDGHSRMSGVKAMLRAMWPTADLSTWADDSMGPSLLQATLSRENIPIRRRALEHGLPIPAPTPLITGWGGFLQATTRSAVGDLEGRRTTDVGIR